jgi:acetyltransferase
MAMFSSMEFAKDIADALYDLNFPTFAVWLGGKEMEAGREILNQRGIPTYPNPEGAIRAFHYMYTYGRNLEMLQEIPSETGQNAAMDPQKAREIIKSALKNKETLLTEVDSKDLLRAYGIPATLAKVAASAPEAKALAQEMGFPVVVKLHSKTITHKSDMGGVILDLRNEKEVAKAFKTIQQAAHEYDPKAHFGGVTIQPMIRQKGQEVILGVKKDPDFGPVIMFGMGGVMTELFKDRAIGLPPLNHLLARRMIEETKVYRLLKGYRNIAQVNLDQLEEIMVRLSQLVIDLPEIAELDINPLLLTPGWASALDARVMIKPAEEPSPLHLSISPYPAEYEGFRETKTGHKLFIRPVKPEDAPMMLELFETMSQKSIYNRFLRKVTVLDRDTLVRFTQVDYDRDLALVALDLSGHKPTMVGLTRLSGDPDGVSAEWAIVVGDPWQGQGIGAMLMNVAIETGKRRGLKRLWGYLLADNTGMVALHRRFGSKLTKTKDGKKYQAVYDLDQ